MVATCVNGRRHNGHTCVRKRTWHAIQTLAWHRNRNHGYGLHTSIQTTYSSCIDNVELAIWFRVYSVVSNKKYHTDCVVWCISAITVLIRVIPRSERPFHTWYYCCLLNNILAQTHTFKCTACACARLVDKFNPMSESFQDQRDHCACARASATRDIIVVFWIIYWPKHIPLSVLHALARAQAHTF